MLISRKLTKDKRVVTDFRHLNMCIVKNNLAYSLLKDTCLYLLGSSQCKVMPVLDSKDAFHSPRLTWQLKEILWHPSLLWKYFLSVSENANGSKYLPHNLAILYQCDTRLLCRVESTMQSQSWVIYCSLPHPNHHILTNWKTSSKHWERMA